MGHSSGRRHFCVSIVYNMMTVSKSTVGAEVWILNEKSAADSVQTRKQHQSPQHRGWGCHYPACLGRHRRKTVYTATMLMNSLLRLGSRLDRPLHKRIHRVTVNYGDLRRREASTAATATAIDDKVKMKTMDDLGGPTFMTTLKWLFVKGYFKKTQQMQVSCTWTRGKQVPLCLRTVVCSNGLFS